MSRVLTFSRTFPSYHPKKGQPTYFVEKLNKSLPIWKYGIIFTDLIHNDIPFFDIEYYKTCEKKYHTIRAGHRWKVGDKFSPRVWGDDTNPKTGRSGPYQSKQIIIAPDLEVKKVWDFKIVTEDDDGESDWSYVEFLGKTYTCYGYGNHDDFKIVEIAKNDGLEIRDFYEWFLTGRTKKQRLNNEPKIFDGQIICWNENINY